MTTISDKLLAKADEYEKRATSLRLAAAELRDELTSKKQATMAVTLAGAIKLRAKQPASRNNGHGGDRRALTPDAIDSRREAILQLLHLGPQRIMMVAKALKDAGHHVSKEAARHFMIQHMPNVRHTGVGPAARWVVNGKGKAKSITTAKKKKKKGYATTVRAQRERSAAWLAKFDTTTPTPVPKDMKPATVGAYIRRGYLRRKDDGYVRTAKPFVP